MTPSTASGKWCPLARVSSKVERELITLTDTNTAAAIVAIGQFIAVATVNRTSGGSPAGGTFCIADKCMNWAWISSSETSGTCCLFDNNESDDAIS